MNLSQLIDAHKGGRSYEHLAKDCGGAPGAKRLQQLVRQPIRNFPDPPTVTALARGLRVSELAVVLAAAESLGLDVSTATPRLLQLLPASAADLSDEQAAAVAHLIAVFARQVDAPETAAAASDDDISPRVNDVLAARRAGMQKIQKTAADEDPRLD